MMSLVPKVPMNSFQESTILLDDVEVTLRSKPVRTLRLVIRPPDGNRIGGTFIENWYAWLRYSHGRTDINPICV
jgi:hypothetical protein